LLVTVAGVWFVVHTLVTAGARMAPAANLVEFLTRPNITAPVGGLVLPNIYNA
jgi:hypothetical protein